MRPDLMESILALAVKVLRGSSALAPLAEQRALALAPW
jgi:hypothetical protein